MQSWTCPPPLSRRQFFGLFLTVFRVLPDFSFIAAAMSCSTKSRDREKRPGPQPLRSEKFPRGLPPLLSSGGWMDLDYACVFLGARRKSQKLRRAGHVALSPLWSPSFPDAWSRILMLAFSHFLRQTAWARKTGWGCELIPCLPTLLEMSEVFSFPPESLRSALMLVTALRPLEASERGVPPRKAASDFPDRILPDNHIYIGPGHFSHRWPVGPWTNHFQSRRDGTAFESLILYMQWIQTQPDLLLDQLPGKILVCDCPHSQLCDGDVLAAMVWSSHSSRPSHTAVGLPSPLCL